MGLRIVSLMLGMSLLSGVAGAALMAAVLRAGPATAKPEVYQAQAFEVIDSAGRRRAALVMGETEVSHGAGLVFYDSDGHPHLTLGHVEATGDEGIIFGIHDDRGRLRLSLGLSQDHAGIAIFDAEGNFLFSAP